MPLLAAVGPLQFEVVQYRLQSEYGAESRLEQAPWTVVRWLPIEMTGDEVDAIQLPTGSRIALDSDGNEVILFPTDWAADYFMQINAKIVLSKLPPPRSLEFKK